MQKSPIYIILFMAATAAVFGGAVSALFVASQNKLQQNKEIRLDKAYLEAFGIADPKKLPPEQITKMANTRVEEGHKITDPQTQQQFTLLKAYQSADKASLVGYGFRFRGLGFWGPIEGILTMTPDLNETLGLVILAQEETPGLGGRIEEPIFKKQFKAGVRISEPADGDTPFILVAASEPDNASLAARHVQSITGATQTSMAMERILNNHIEAFHRAMNQRTDTETASNQTGDN